MASTGSNLEIVRGLVLAQNREDDEGFVAGFHDDVVWLAGPNQFGLPEVLRGHREILDAARDARARFGKLTILLHDLREAGDQVLVLGTLSGGRNLAMPRAWIWTMRDGKAAKVRSFSSRQRAIQAFEAEAPEVDP